MNLNSSFLNAVVTPKGLDKTSNFSLDLEFQISFVDIVELNW
jgi:hypothetical protein